MRQQITPLQFAHAVHAAVGYRSGGGGISTYEAVSLACTEGLISKDWIMPILGFLDSSPSAAEAWCERVREEAFRRIDSSINQTSETGINQS